MMAGCRAMTSRELASLTILTAAAALLPTQVHGADTPSVVISTARGYPQIDINRTNATCPEGGLDSGVRQRILDVAAGEWSAFGFPRFNLTSVRGYGVIPPVISPNARRTRTDGRHLARLMPIGFMEDDRSVRERIGRYWAAVDREDYRDVFAKQNEIWRLSGGRAGWVEYWSAAFVSYVMCKAGLKNDDEFVRDDSHRAYIQAAVESRDGERTGYAYTAHDLGERRPSPGDLICAAREDARGVVEDLKSYRNNPHNSFHCDIVVGFDAADVRRARVLYAIGGNVINAVSMTETPISKGRLTKLRTPHGRNWFAILKLSDAASAASFKKIPVSILGEAEARARLWKASPAP
jgi:hypothetical protein